MKRRNRLQDGASSPDTQVVLSRSLLEEDGLAALILRDAPTQRLTSEADRAASLGAMLEARPKDIWVFAYGSLLWNPTIAVAEARRARISGWHRSFCLSTTAGRGYAEPDCDLLIGASLCTKPKAAELARREKRNRSPP